LRRSPKMALLGYSPSALPSVSQTMRIPTNIARDRQRG
jgi:hypothetical protein